MLEAFGKVKLDRKKTNEEVLRTVKEKCTFVNEIRVKREK